MPDVIVGILRDVGTRGLPTLAIVLVAVWVGKLVRDLLTRYKVDEELTGKNNAAVGIALAGYYIGLAIAITGVIFLFIVLLFLITGKYAMESNGLTLAEKKSLSREQREILAMLRQQGKSMIQTEVADNINGDLTYVDDIFFELEKRAKIRRCWDTDRGGYLVSAV